ncbi:lycopene cyclase domain-containing protein [Streptomyces sp. NPDC086783]|uniref:lycopene cyclase domain-containing protein n=1 Tax=Streptomyces sp. NPDC086783 TaxID=3365758 RepID=UPI00380762DF
MLAACTVARHREPRSRRQLRVTGWVTAVLVAAALLWTTPWDSWIIQHGVWSYPSGGVIATWWRVPLEEYLFMAGQTALVALWSLTCQLEMSPVDPPLTLSYRNLRRWAGCGLWLTAAAAGAVTAAVDPHMMYLGTLLAWFGPLLALQAGVGADLVASRRQLRVIIVLPAWLYLCYCDRIAIAAGTWHLSAAHTIGWQLLGLPLEEIAFFAITSLLIANALILATDLRTPGRLALHHIRTTHAAGHSTDPLMHNANRRP